MPFRNRNLRLVITAEDSQFDATILDHWKDEGYAVTYLAMDNLEEKEYRNRLMREADGLDLGEKYAIVAFGDAALAALNICFKPMPKLCALVAYYPPSLPSFSIGYPSTIRVLVHLPGQNPKVDRVTSYSYPDAQPGFAERDMEEWEPVSADLAWGRSVACVRKQFDIEVDLESVWEEHLALEFTNRNADATMRTMVPQPYVNHIPTITGGIGYDDLYRFYRDFFIPNNPPSLKMRLLSRTIGTTRIVDEMLASFQHTTEIPWLLPGVDPTNRWVEIALVSIVQIRGGKLCHEHIYWDQASVLVQIGLLDPETTLENGLRLPVFGREAARKVLNKDEIESNDLIDDWWSSGEDEDGEDANGEETDVDPEQRGRSVTVRR
ncbi:MAG: hypothetical protein M1834_002589 [Cirrosporium novae-zelandiae]|nr:MAG: hypothetical protein M1834_002589 [Cirrosporium novae-zelandiae]